MYIEYVAQLGFWGALKMLRVIVIVPSDPTI